jgi:hypothetical protein
MDYVDKIEIHDLMSFFPNFPLVHTCEWLNQFSLTRSWHFLTKCQYNNRYVFWKCDDIPFSDMQKVYASFKKRILDFHYLSNFDVLGSWHA